MPMFQSEGWSRLRRIAAMAALMTLTAPVALADPMPALDVLPEGWTTLTPGGETLCATGTPYSFHVNPSSRDKLLVFFNGGGACWNGDLCDLETEPTPYIFSAEDPHNDPRVMKGAFDEANAENPFAGWSKVFVSYCTGDVHLGARDQDYTTAAGKSVRIHHRGKINAHAALDWIYANFAKPARIVVAGGSAGSIASPYYALEVAEHYPDASIVQFGGGSGGYTEQAATVSAPAWGLIENLPATPEFDLIRDGAFTFDDLYRATHARFPNMHMAQFNNAYDEAQEMFLKLIGDSERLYGPLKANLDRLAADVPMFRSYTAPGIDHTLLRFDRLYTTTVGGVRAVDWVKDLIEGREVTNVTCGAPEACEGEPPPPKTP